MMNLSYILVGIGDTWSYLWYLDHTLRNISAGNWAGLWFTRQIMYPYGISLILDVPLLNSLIAYPIYACCGLLASYYWIIYISFLISFLGYYIFFKEFPVSRIGALAGAGAVTFSYYRMTRLAGGQVDLLSTHWVGFILFFWYRWINGSTQQDRKYGYFMAFMMIVQAYTDTRTLTYLSILLLLHWVYTILRKLSVQVSEAKRILFDSFRFIVLIGIGILPLVWAYGASNAHYPEIGYDQWLHTVYMYSADVAGLIFPITQRNMAFVGWGSLTCILVIIWQRKVLISRREAVFWAMIILVTLSVSFGPRLWINGHMFDVPFMPYVILQIIGLQRFLHVPYRFVFLSWIGLGLFTAIGITVMEDRFHNKRWIHGLFGLVMVFGIGVQSIFLVPYPLQMYTPHPFTTILSRDVSGALLPIPFAYADAYRHPPDSAAIKALYYQLFHDWPLVGGYVSVLTRDLIDTLKRDTEMQKWLVCQNEKKCDESIGNTLHSLFARYGIRYLWVEDSEDDEYIHITRILSKLPEVRFMVGIAEQYGSRGKNESFLYQVGD